MKKRLLLLLFAIISIISISYFKDYFKPTELIEKEGSLRAGSCDILSKIDITLENSNIEIVGEGENIDRLEMVGESEVKSEPLIFPDTYFNPETEAFNEEEFWDDLELVALVCVAEAEGESEYGKRLVIDTILNRAESEYFPNSIYGVVYDNSQYSCVWDGRLDRVEYDEYIANLVLEEMNNRTNSDVIYFKTKGYFGFGTPLLKEGNHYFSGR